jgi:Fe-S-cluster-containing hydrogenase component 2
MQKVLHINADKCTGCMQCEMACSFENYGTYATAKSRIKVFEFHHTGKKVPYTCTQCDEAWCLHACPVEAITVDKATGAKVVNETTCVGCKVCTIACPFGTINYVAGDRKGSEVRPVWGRAGLRRGVPDRCHHLHRRQLDGAGQDGPVGRQAWQPTHRRLRSHASCLGLEKFSAST